jgi:uncharacterized protein with PIN domain
VEQKFIIDINVGKLVRWMRMMGYDAILFNELDDGLMVKKAIAQGRIIITKDSEFMKRRAVSGGRVKVVLVSGDDPEQQMKTVIRVLDLDKSLHPFTRCIECNSILINREKEQIKDEVPPRVLEKQDQYMECPNCHRIYWRGTHWQDMCRKLQLFAPNFPQF